MPEQQQEEEVVIDDDEYIVSRTDKDGIITYVSDSFCRISEYTKEELLGKPHNIIRHDDMPRAAFKELWETIKQGDKWQGYVKNRTKYGKFYWVEATVTPFVKDGKMLGYKSVRKKTNPDILQQKIYQYNELRKKEREEMGEIDSSEMKLGEQQKVRISVLAERMKEPPSRVLDKMITLMEKAIMGKEKR